MSEQTAEKAESGPERPEPEITIREVAQAIGWLDSMEELQFDGADWSHVDDDGVVTLEGRKGDLLVWVTVEIKEVSWEPEYTWDEDDEGDADDAGL